MPEWDESVSAPENARSRLPGMVEAWFQRGRALAAPEANSPAALHSFRIRTKRLRYTLEMFRPFYGPRLDARLAALREVQTCLGELNDCAVTRGLIEPALKPGPQRARLEAFLDRRTTELTAAFKKTWAALDKAGEDARWRAYLAR